MTTATEQLNEFLDRAFGAWDQALEAPAPPLTARESGRVVSLGESIATVEGLPRVKADELLRFPGDRMGYAFNLDPDLIGVVLLDESEGLEAGDEVRGVGRTLDVAVGEELLGRVVDPLGRPLDRKGRVRGGERRAIEREAAGIMDRSPVTVPLQTGIKAVDALIPIGRGQRELILGDRQTGKTAIAVDTILNQHDKNVVCVYCAIGQRSSAVARVIAKIEQSEAIAYSVVVVTTEDDPPGLRFAAPYAATSIGEFFRDRGRDALVVYDDLTRHARAYREVSLLLRRPPGREAFPGDIFYIHSRLLERSTHLRDEHGGGSLTALPIIETEAQNLSAYIPTNLISITDGQIYLNPGLYQKGVMPAIDVGLSVSRVGGKTQLPAYRTVAGDLRLSYSQFEELETFARFGTRLDEDTRRQLDRGRRVREILKQSEADPLPAHEQIAVLLAVTEGLFDPVAIDDIGKAERAIRDEVRSHAAEVCRKIDDGEKIGDDEVKTLKETVSRILDETFGDKNGDEADGDT